MEKNSSTEEKIKDAARKVFTQKGYAATRTRDIADESGLNLALINYYFRSKEKLFEIIMMENIEVFVVNNLAQIANNKETTLREKIELIVSSYIDMLLQNPDLPLFIMTEIKRNPENFILKRMEMRKRLEGSHLFKQLEEVKRMQNKQTIHPMQLLMNVMGMMIFPFIASPIVQHIGDIGKEEFVQLMQDRKKLIPMWIGMMVGVGG